MNINAAYFGLNNLFKVVLVFFVMAISGCGIHKDDPSVMPTAAKVNRSEITVEQINFVLQQQGVPPGQSESVRRDILERLINQELTLQRAKELQLEHDAKVAQQIDAVNRDLIARAYIDRVVSGVPKPTNDEVRQYYEKNPAFFKDRKIFHFMEYNIVTDSSHLEGLTSNTSSVNDVRSITDLLNRQGLVFSDLKISKAIEELPIANIETFTNLQKGQYILSKTDFGFQLWLLLGAEARPLSEEHARQSIEKFIFNENKRKVIDADLKSLREAAHIEYFGDYAKDGLSRASNRQGN